jgi:hypothetical protein
MRSARIGVAVVSTVLAALVVAASASAALPLGCAEAGTTVTCTYSTVGSEGTFVVPVGVTNIHVVAVGAAGTTNANGFAPGAGAEVSGYLAVSPLTTLYVEVGIDGGAGASIDGGNGGGESDVRTCSVSAVGCPSLGSPQDPRLIVAGGGGGAGAFGGGGPGGAGGVGSATGCNAGANGGDGDGGEIGDFGSGGGCSSGGAGGAGSSTGGVAGSAGTAGSGGPGGGSTSIYGGGGGGGGYYGGGGGGSAGTGAGNSAGGGGGSSYGPSDSVFTTASVAASVAISYSVPAAQMSSGLTFTTQPQSTVSPSQTVTVSNTGGAPLDVTGVTFAGTDPGDYLVTFNGCLGPVAVGDSCSIGVSFAPQGQGTRSATLKIASNDPASPETVSLSGTGGSLPQGPAGQTGATGTTGTTGATGPRGPAGKIELVTCKTKHNGKETCRSKLVSGTVKFSTARDISKASIARAGVLYATGDAQRTAHGGYELLLSYRHSLPAGRYTLTLDTRNGRHWQTQRRSITLN